MQSFFLPTKEVRLEFLYNSPCLLVVHYCKSTLYDSISYNTNIISSSTALHRGPCVYLLCVVHSSLRVSSAHNGSHVCISAIYADCRYEYVSFTFLFHSTIHPCWINAPPRRHPHQQQLLRPYGKSTGTQCRIHTPHAYLT